MSAGGDVDWATVGAVAGKLGQALADVADVEVGAEPGSLAAVRRALTLLQQVARRAAGAGGTR